MALPYKPTDPHASGHILQEECVDVNKELLWFIHFVHENKKLIESIEILIPDLIKTGLTFKTLTPEQSVLYRELEDAVKVGGGNGKLEEYITRISKLRQELAKPLY